MRTPATLVAVVGATALLGACGSANHPSIVEGGSPEAGHAAIVTFGCGSCHQIGGVTGANGRVGPTLRNFDTKRYIAGRLPVTPENAIRWIRDPQAIEPETIMPNLGVSERQARDIVAYLYGQ